MKKKWNKIFAVLILIAVIVGSVVTVGGAGKKIKPIKEMMKYGLDINGGVYVVMEADTKAKGQELKQLMDQTRAVLNNRVNAMGISEATVSIEGEKRLRIEMPGVKDANEAISQIGRTAQLKFILADGSVALNGENVKDAQISTDSEHGGYKINLKFDSKGAALFEEATRKAFNGEVTPTIEGMGARQIAIVLDDKIITAPEVQSVINSGSCEITQGNGGYKKADASTTAALIRGGSLPTTLHDVTSSVQTATIGEDALNKSIKAGLVGLLLVFLLMLFVYRGLGLIADFALLLYVLIVLWAMAGMGMVLTLPGIAGIILSIGMAVDANVIIFSRIKEEVYQGKSIRVAVDQGFKHALTTVLDAQITTLIAAVVLYEIGSTTVKGFALTLMIGIVVSIFTAVVVTQLFVGLVASSKKFAKNSFFGIKDAEKKSTFAIDFLSKRKIFYAFSIIVILVGAVTMGTKGLNYGIDFTGGTMIEVDMGKKVASADIEKSLEQFDLNPSIIFGGEGKERVVIKTIKSVKNEQRKEIINKLSQDFGITKDAVLSSEEFGPTVGKELKTNAIKSILIAAVGMLIYIVFRFKNWKYGVSSIVGVLHDVLILLAIYAVLGITINNPFIAGILTIVGYSINDTIVIFDRIRENLRLHRKGDFKDVLNMSINQTLGRSIMTSLTTMICMIPLLIMVSSSIREFVIPLMAGVLVGTYSSIFLCTPLFYEMSKSDRRSKYERKHGKKSH